MFIHCNFRRSIRQCAVINTTKLILIFNKYLIKSRTLQASKALDISPFGNSTELEQIKPTSGDRISLIMGSCCNRVNQIYC